MVVKRLQSDREQKHYPPTQLSMLAGYQSFGAYLALKRKQFGLLQKEMAARFSLSASSYGFLERGRRAPEVNELVPMFAAFVQLQNDKRLPPMQIIEAVTFFRLGRVSIENKQKKRPNVSQREWDEIEQQLINLVDSRQRSQIRLFSGEHNASSPTVVESPDSRRRKALKDVLKTDLSHLLERETWVQRVLAYPDQTPQIKVSLTQAGMGAGKSHALALLTQQLAERDDLFLIPYQFKHSETMTADDHLDEFLATLHADLTMQVTDELKRRPLTERIDQVLVALRALDQKVILLLDDAHEMFPSASEWSASLHQFFAMFLSEPHTATLYMMTRVWPGWDERKRAFLAEEDLPDLSVAAGIQLWQWQGFDDVNDHLLRKVCERCGQNPQTIEMLAFQYKRRGFSIDWKGSFQNTNENPHTTSLKKLLASDALFSGNLDDTSRQMLQQVFSNRLSGEDLKLLECLALSPLGVPFAILEKQFDFAAQSYEALVKASFADLTLAATGRAAVVPLVREAMLQSLPTQRKREIEQLVTDMYAYWLQTVQDFRDDAEKAALITEMVVRYIRQRHLLQAAELFLRFGWLCTLFGHTARIQRVYETTIREDRGQEEHVEHEVGRLILRHRIAVYCGPQVERDERDQIYQDIYHKIVAGEVTLEPHSELEVLHNMLLFYNRKGQLAEANAMFDRTLEHLQFSGKMTSEVYALFLFDKGRLMSYQADREKQSDASLRLTQASVNCVKECIKNWRVCLKNALPLQEHYIQYKLARALNDLACDLRTLEQYADAQEAIEESIRLKRKSSTPAYSIAIALSEYSQILAAQGKIRVALSFNDEAKEMLEQAIAHGDDVHKPEFGLILSERANIVLLQARVREAKSLLEQSVDLMEDKPLRRKEREKAKVRMEEIHLLTTSSYQLDRRWFSRFSDLVDFNDTEWLTQAGPFTEEEFAEWQRLSSQQDEQSHHQMSLLIAQSKKREFTRSLEEHCEPIFYYPRLPLDDARNRLNSLATLRQEIEKQEANMVVRRLYLDAIDENLAFLRLCEAIGLQDSTTAMQCNLQLYGKPSEREMTIALHQLCNMLLDARTHELAGSVAQEALIHLEKWGISPQKLVVEELFIPSFDQRPQQINRKLLESEKRTFSTVTISKFFQDVLAMYGENDWKVFVNPARDHTSVDPNIRELILPEKSFSVQKVRQLLAEEIEVHAYRAIAGRNSSLALLGSGLAHHLAADEGLAYHYVQSVHRQVYGKYEEKKWNATLTTGFVSGVLTHHALSFPELRGFLEKMFLVSELLDGATWEDAFEFARQAAWRRCCRVFRGAGCVSLKDRVYLQGHLEVSDYLAHGGEEQRLYVGCVGIDHLEDVAELGILAPNHPHQHLALANDLAERIASYEK